MTLELWSWLAIAALGGGFLVLTAYIAETWPRENPLDDRSQAHPRRSGEPPVAIVSVPHAGAVRPDGSPDLRERINRPRAGE